MKNNHHHYGAELDGECHFLSDIIDSLIVYHNIIAPVDFRALISYITFKTNANNFTNPKAKQSTY